MKKVNILLGVVTLVEICTAFVAPVGTFRTLMPGEVRPEPRSILLSYHHSELLKPGEDRPEARSISLSVSATELIMHLKAGRKGHPSKPKKV